MALRHEKRVLQKSEINLGREGCSQAVNFPEVRNEIVALKKLEQEQKEVALRIAQIEEGIRKIEAAASSKTRKSRTKRWPNSRKKRNRSSNGGMKQRRLPISAIANWPAWSAGSRTTTPPTANS